MRIINVLVLSSVVWSSALWADWEGRTVWAGITKLSTPLTGMIEQVLVTPGEYVRQGQVLLRMDQRVVRARVAEAVANAEYASLQQQEMARELERAEELYERTLLADHELDLARIAAARGMAEYRAAQAAEAKAREALLHSELRAPFAARVLSQHVASGEIVNNQFFAIPMLVVANSEQMLVSLRLGAEQVVGLSQGMALVVEVDGERHPASLKAISYDPGSGDYHLEVLFTPSQRIIAGMPARVRLP